MCGRLDQHEKREAYAECLEAMITPRTDEWRPRWNLPATEPVLIGVPWQGERRLGVARFGWPNPVAKGVLLNAKSEKMAKSPLWSRHLASGRCIVPVNGWWEWAKLIAHRPIPHHFQMPDGKALLAGLWQQKEDQAHVVVLTMSALLTASAIVHDRLPVVLRPEESWQWAEAPLPEALAMIAEPRPGVTNHIVGPDVGNVRSDGPHLAKALSTIEWSNTYFISKEK